jgi:MaoC like domain
VSDVERTAELEAIRRKLVPLTAYRQLLNGPEQVSDWLLVDQPMIDRFADATHDHQFIHIDQQRAESETPFGGTIAHGFERVRFLKPGEVGSWSGKFSLVELTERAVAIHSASDTVVEAEGVVKPAIERTDHLGAD